MMSEINGKLEKLIEDTRNKTKRIEMNQNQLKRRFQRVNMIMSRASEHQSVRVKSILSKLKSRPISCACQVDTYPLTDLNQKIMTIFTSAIIEKGVVSQKKEVVDSYFYSDGQLAFIGFSS